MPALSTQTTPQDKLPMGLPFSTFHPPDNGARKLGERWARGGTLDLGFGEDSPHEKESTLSLSRKSPLTPPKYSRLGKERATPFRTPI